MDVSEIEKRLLSQVLELLIARAPLYESCVQVTILWERPEGWRNLLTKLDFTRKGTDRPLSAKLNYQDVAIIRQASSIDGVASLIQTLTTEGLLRYGAMQTVQLEGRLRASGTPSRLLRSEWSQWPADIFIFEPIDAFRISPPYKSFAAVDAPYYPSLEHVLRDQFGIRSKSWSGYFSGQVVIVLPDFRARISALTIAQSYLRAEFECPFLSPSDLVVQVYAENATGKLYGGAPPLDGRTVQVDLSDRPTFASVALLARGASELLDEKTYLEGAAWRDPGVILETSESEIEQMLLIGEGETLEFREKLDNPLRLAKTVVAFSNTRGGVIVVGVDDDHHAVGCEPKGLSDHVTNVLRAHCDPFPAVTTDIVSYQDKKLFLVRVPRSTGGVFVVREHGPYVRANRSNRTPTPHELENLCGGRQGLSL